MELAVQGGEKENKSKHIFLKFNRTEDDPRKHQHSRM
jgi:hypothetical protein